MEETSGINWTPRASRATVALVAIVEIDIALVGSAEGVPVELTGHGSVDTVTGPLALEVRSSRRLLLFDPALVALGLLDLLALAATHAAPGDTDAPVHVRSRTDIYDEHGREAGGWRVVESLARTGGHVRLDGKLLDHVAHIEPGERVVAVDAPWVALVQPLESGGVLLAGAWDARTGRGNGYRGVTTTVVDGWPVVGPGQTSRICLDHVKVRRGSDGCKEFMGIDGTCTAVRLGILAL